MSISNNNMFLFDAHNHIHLSLEGGIPPLSRLDHLHEEKDVFSSLIDSSNEGKQTGKRAVSSDCFLGEHIIDNHSNLIRQSFLSNLILRNTADAAEHSSNVITPSCLVNGMAIMSTQPRDFNIVQQLSHALSTSSEIGSCDSNNDGFDQIPNWDNAARNALTAENNNINFDQQNIIPCFGVHPWFLKEANHEFEEIMTTKCKSTTKMHLSSNLSHIQNIVHDTISSTSYQQFIQSISSFYYCENEDSNDRKASKKAIPLWLPYLYHQVISNKISQIGEIGLDNARYDGDSESKEIVTPMEDQIIAFEIQLHLASHLQKSVSIHSVRCWGMFMDSLRTVKEQRKRMRKEMKAKVNKLKVQIDIQGTEEDTDLTNFYILPPHLYMHAFGGKPSIVDQVNAICTKDNVNNPCQVYYGFAPIINFRAPKTADTIRKVGIDSLVLESDLEDVNRVVNDLNENIKFVANALQVDIYHVAEKTNENARRLYRITS